MGEIGAKIAFRAIRLFKGPIEAQGENGRYHQQRLTLRTQQQVIQMDMIRKLDRETAFRTNGRFPFIFVHRSQ